MLQREFIKLKKAYEASGSSEYMKLLQMMQDIYGPDVIPTLEAMKRNWDGPIGAYPHSGDWVGPNWQFVNMISPEDYVEVAKDWRQQGAQIVGGCCGIGEDYIKSLRAAFPG